LKSDVRVFSYGIIKSLPGDYNVEEKEEEEKEIGEAEVNLSLKIKIRKEPFQVVS